MALVIPNQIPSFNVSGDGEFFGSCGLGTGYYNTTDDPGATPEDYPVDEPYDDGTLDEPLVDQPEDTIDERIQTMETTDEAANLVSDKISIMGISLKPVQWFLVGAIALYIFTRKSK